MRKSKKGFTIVELVIVIAVIAILAAVLVPTFTNLVTKANISADASTVKTLNTYLAVEEGETGKKPQTMSEVVDILNNHGYNLERLHLSNKSSTLLWNQETNRFIIKNGNEVIYAANDENADYKLWEIVKTIPAEQKYNLYLNDSFEGTTANVSVGLDTGKNDQIKVITYTHTSGAARNNVIIRTCGLDTEVSINAKNDLIKHYGKAGSVSIVSVGSVQENAVVPFVEIAGGNLVVESSAKVTAIHFNATDGKFENEDQKQIFVDLSKVQVANAPSFSRDGVEIENEVLVAKVDDLYIWLTGNGTIENAEVKTSTSPDGIKTSAEATVSGNSIAEQVANTVVENIDGTTTYEPKVTKEEAQEIIEDAKTEEVLAEAENQDKNFVARIGVRGYESLEKAVENAVNNDTIYLLKDSTLQSRLTISGKNLTIDGGVNKYSITVLNENIENGRAINIFDGNIAVKFKNLKLVGPTSGSYTRGLNIADENVKLDIENCEISSNTYAINFCSGTTIDVNIIDSKISGWAALNIWSDGISVVVKNSTLEGINDKSYDKWNTFSTICFEGDSTHKTTLHSENMNLYCENSTIIAKSTTGNRQDIIGFNSDCLNNKASFVNCNFVLDNASYNHMYYNNGTNNSLKVDGFDYLRDYTQDVDTTDLVISQEGNSATGSIKFIFGDQVLTFNLEDAEVSQWSNTAGSGTDYVFSDVTLAGKTYSLDLDISTAYPDGFHLYVF